MCGHEWEFFILNWRLCTKQKRKIQQKKIIPAPTSPSIKDCDVEHYKCIYRTTAIYLILNRWNMFYSGKNATLFRSIVEMLAIVSEINNFWLDVNNFISNSHLQNDQPFTFKNHSITMNAENRTEFAQKCVCCFDWNRIFRIFSTLVNFIFQLWFIAMLAYKLQFDEWITSNPKKIIEGKRKECKQCAPNQI